MDNLTHSLVGLGIGALVDRSLPDEAAGEHQGLRTRLLLAIGCLASNVPDLDLVLTHTLEPPLGYLLEHRGHTHTLVGALVELVVLLGAIWLLWPAARRLLSVSGAARGGALFTAVAGLLLHIGMDSLNVYGVHPFWPFDARWYYGDLVFIVEPVFWIGFGVPLACMVGRKPLRCLLFGLMAALPAAGALAGYLEWGSLAGLLALGAALGFVQRRTRTRPRGPRSRAALAAGLLACLAFVGVQAMALRQARALVVQQLRSLDPAERVLDTALSAYPANPLCWSFVAVERSGNGDGAQDSYHLRRGLLSIAPAISPVQSCPAALAGAAGSGGSGRLAWQSEQRAPIAALKKLRATNCHVDAWLRFARAPVFAPGAGVATDARWGLPGSPNFSSLWYAQLAPLPCPHPVPGWDYPRADLLGLHAQPTAIFPK
jgi:inner membrane protein